MFKLLSLTGLLPARKQGRVLIVGAGPGAADLLTRRAEQALLRAQTVFYDDLVSKEVLALCASETELVYVGKRKGAHSFSQAEINALLIEEAKKGRTVVRLKAGDPSVYGRSGEEMQALEAAGIDFEVVPGITAALAAAADAKLSLTLRGLSSSLVLATGHAQEGGELPDWADQALKGATVAVYMGRTVAHEIAEKLIAAGLEASTPVLAVENASRANQRLFSGTIAELGDLAARADVSGPVLILIGKVAATSLSDALEPLELAPQEGLYAVLRKAS